MNTVKLTLVLVGILGLLLGLNAQTWASSPAPGDICCLIVNPGAGALSLRGTGSLVYTPVSNHNVDFTLRLERRGVVRFFRLNIFGEAASLMALTNEGVACLLLNPRETNNAEIRERVRAFADEILGTFFGLTSETHVLAITRNSISNVQGVSECRDDQDPPQPTNCVIPGTDPVRISTLGDITIYAVERARANYEFPACTQRQ